MIGLLIVIILLLTRKNLKLDFLSKIFLVNSNKIEY